MAVGLTGKCSKLLLFGFNIIFWAIGLTLLGLGIWLLVDPKRSYIVELVETSGDEPLLKYAACLFIAIGAASVLIGFVGCCGALKESPGLLVTYSILLVIILLAELAAGILAVLFFCKFTNALPKLLSELTVNQYGRQKWATQLMDTIQFHDLKYTKQKMMTMLKYHYGSNTTDGVRAEILDRMQFFLKCCGVDSSEDWTKSQWRAQNANLVSVSKPNIVYPYSCCVQKYNSLLTDMVIKNPHLCQNVLPDLAEESRNEKQQCCGYNGIDNYLNSYWRTVALSTNNNSLNVPKSCCVQSSGAYPPDNINPVDSNNCQKWDNVTGPNEKYVYAQGCYKNLLSWLSETSIVIIAMSFSAAAIQLLGIACTLCLCRNVGEEF